MLRVNLSRDEARPLEPAFRQAGDRRLRDRVPIVLMAHHGKPHGQIAADPAEEVRRWLIEGPSEQGLDRANRMYA